MIVLVIIALAAGLRVRVLLFGVLFIAGVFMTVWIFIFFVVTFKTMRVMVLNDCQYPEQYHYSQLDTYTREFGDDFFKNEEKEDTAADNHSRN